MRNDLREACPSRRAVLSSLKEMNCVRYHQEEAKKQAKTYCDCREDWWKFVCGRGVGLRFQIFEADLETSRFDECLVKQTNFKPPWMRSFLIPDVRNKWCSIPYPSGDYLKAVPSILRKWINPDCECCLGSLAVTLFASINLIKEIVFDEVSTKTWCHIYKTFIKILEDGGGLARSA